MPKLDNVGDEQLREPDRAPRLQIYVARHCPICEEARRLARVVRYKFPALAVDVIDLTHSKAEAGEVFAVPTYVLNGRVRFLGNPSEEELCDLLVRELDSSA